MGDETEDIWKACKIVEEDENGELRLLQDNLDKLQRYLDLNGCDVAELNIISVIGAHENENAFLTNLLPVYLKKNGQTSWPNSLSTDGLGGFAFGTIVDKKEVKDLNGSENSNKDNLLQRADNDNQQHPPNQENSKSLDQENEEQKRDSICESFSEMALDTSHVAIPIPEDDSQEAPAHGENSETDVSSLNLQQRKQIYETVSKLILLAGKLPQTCGDKVSAASGALFSAAQEFERISTNPEDDTESGLEDFVVVENNSQKFEEFVACSEALMKLAERRRILSESTIVIQTQTEAKQEMDESSGLVNADQPDNKNENVDSRPGESNNSQGGGGSNGNNLEGDHSTEKDNSGPSERHDLSSEKGNNGKQGCDNALEKSYEPMETDSLPENDNNGQSIIDKLPEQDNNGLVRSDDLLEIGNGQKERENSSDKGNNGQVENSIGPQNVNSTHVECSTELEKVTNEQEDSKEKQADDHTEQIEGTIGEADTNANQQPDEKDVNETTRLDQDHSDNENKQSTASSNLFQPEENKNAVYVYPQIISPENNGKGMKWCILHLHKKPNTDPAQDKLRLEQFLLEVCTRIVWISDKEATTSASRSVALDPSLHQKVFNIVIENPEESNFQITTNPKGVQVTKDTFSPGHDGSGILTLSPKHLRTLSTLLNNITEFPVNTSKEFDQRAVSLQHANFPQYISCKLKEFNFSPEFMVRMSSQEQKPPQIPMSSTKQEEITSSTSETKQSKSQDDTKVDKCLVQKMGALTVEKIPDPPEDKVIEASIRKNWKELDHKLAEWIEKELDFSNVHKMMALYESWLTDITRKITKLKEMEKVKISKIKESMKQRASEKCKPIIDEVIRGLEKFSVYFRDHYEKKFCYQSSEIEKILEDQKTKLMTSSDKVEAVKLMSWGYDKLAGILRKYNKTRIDARKNICLETKHKIRNAYAEKFEKILSSKIQLDPDTLGQFNDALTSDLLGAYEKSVNNNVADVDNLSHNLKADFQNFFDRNMLNLELSQKKVKGLIGKSKSGYEEIMDNLLKKNKCGINPEDFEKTHLEESSKAEKLLKRSIQTDKELNEPLEKHLVTLKTHIEKSYKTFKEDNEEFLEKSQKLGKGIEADDSTDSTNGSKMPQQKTSRKITSVLENLSIGNQSPREPAPKKIKRELPPLLYQIALRKISIATLPVNSWESNSGTVNIQSHSGAVGILMDGKWVCGDDIKELNNQGKVQKFWSFEALFNLYDFNDTLVGNKEHLNLNITLPFLLGVFFGLMKQKAENEQNGNISAAMISVPFWFSSHKRRQIVEAGSIAGFDNVQLINENTASAYFAYTNGLCPPSEKMIVISENSNKVDIAIYSYDHESKIVCMRGQAGDYETGELSNDKSFIRKFVTGTLAYLFYNQQEKGIKEKALESLEKFWKLAKSRLKTRLSNVNRTVLICCESDHWREFLYKFAEKITSENISVRNDSPLLGLASLFQSYVSAKTRSVESFFKDAIPFNVTLTNGNQNLAFRIKESTFSSSETRQIGLDLPKDFECLTFNEDGLALERFGTFCLKSKPPNLFSIKATLDRTRNGIFNLTAIDYAEGARYEWSGIRKPLPKYCFEWHPCKTTDETLATYRSLMDQINLQTKSFGEVENVLKLTEEKAMKIKQAIQACTDKFKSSVGKNIVIRQIDEIIEALKQPGIQGKVLKKHAYYLDEIVKKYDLKI